MDVQFWYTASGKLAGLPIQDGRIIALKDKPGYYYDQAGRRYRVNNIEFVKSTEDLRENILPELKKLVRTAKSSTDREGLLDLLYLTPDGIFQYDYESQTLKTRLPVDVKEVADGNNHHVYGRTNGKWTQFRWILVCDEVATETVVNSIIANLIANHISCGLKIAGQVSVRDSLDVHTESESAVASTFYLDLQDAELQGSGTIDITTREHSTIRVVGAITHTVNISGRGHVEIADSRISANINVSQFSGSLSIHDCVAQADKQAPTTMTYQGSGTCAISGCSLTGCTIELSDECVSFINNNILIDVTVKQDGKVLDALYNNAGYNTEE